MNNKDIYWSAEISKLTCVYPSTKKVWQLCPLQGRDPSIGGDDWYEKEFENDLIRMLDTKKASGFGAKLGSASGGLIALTIDKGATIPHELPLTIATRFPNGAEVYFFQSSATGFNSELNIQVDGFQPLPPSNDLEISCEWINSPETSALAIAPDWMISPVKKIKVSLNRQAINKKIIQKVVNGQPVFYPELKTGEKDDRYNKITDFKYWESIDLTMAELAEHIRQGYAWMACAIDAGKRRKAENCNYTECLPIDVDNTDHARDAQGVLLKDAATGGLIKVYKEELTLQAALEHPFIKEHAALIIPSASHTDDWNKFRIVFPLREALTSRKQIESAYKYLLELLPCGDKACKDSSRFFYGAKDAEIILLNESATLPENFIFNVFDYEESKAKQEQERLRARQYWAQKHEATDDTEQNAINALNCIPARGAKGSNTYLHARDCFWALINEFGESKAISIMSSHSPSYGDWDLDYLASKYDASRSVGIGTLFLHAKAYGFRFPEKPNKGSAVPSTSTILKGKGVDTTDKKYTVQRIHLCDRHVQRILMGESESVTMNLIVKAYKELKGWDNAIAKLRPDTVPTVNIESIIKSVARANHFDLTKVDAVIANIDKKSEILPQCFVNGGDSAITLIEAWRVEFLESGSDEEKKEFDKEQKNYMRGRVFRLLRDNLKFNSQIKEWFEYEHGVFNIKIDDEINGVIRHTLKLLAVADWHLTPAQIKDATVKETLENLKNGLVVDRFDKRSLTDGLINLRDGVYDRIAKELRHHSPAYGFTVQLPYRWENNDSNSAAPIIKWLWWALDGKIDQVMFALCYLNAIVCRRSDIQVFMQIIGKAGAGKSTFTRLAKSLVGHKNVMSTSIKLLEDKFEPSNFIGKPLIEINEVDPNFKSDGSMIKNMCGGDTIFNRIKHSQSRGQEFVFDGKLIITGNEEWKPLRVFDDWDRRNRVLKFEKVVAKSKIKNLIETKEDGSIDGEFAPHVPAFLKLVLSIPDDLVKSVLLQPEIYAPSMTDTRQESILKENSIAQWLEECVVFNRDAKTYIGVAKKMNSSETNNGVTLSKVIFGDGQDKEKLHPHYVQWCNDRGMPYVGQQRFSPDLLRICNGTLKLDFVKKLNRDSVGTAIAGLELRTRYHENIPTPIKRMLMVSTVNADTQHDQTGSVAYVQEITPVTLQYESILAEYLGELRGETSESNIQDTKNISESLKGKDLNICDRANSTVQSICDTSVEASTQPLKQGDLVVVDIADPDTAEIVLSFCQVTPKTVEYRIETLVSIHGTPMAYISNGKPVGEPIGVEYLKKVQKRLIDNL